MIKTALITGGSRGIGRAAAVKLAGQGCFVLINYLSNDEEAAKTLELVRANNGDGELMKFDVSNQNEVTNVLGGWLESHSRHQLEVLVNNAGIRRDNLLVFMENEDWTNVLSTNLNSFYNVTKTVLKSMIINKYGRIINVVSLSGLKGLPGQVNYSAAKAGLIGATKALAQEVGKKKITVNAVAPGYIKTDMTADLDESVLKQMIPLNRFGTSEEVAEVIAFLASPGASYITGEVISVNGGLYT